MLDPYPIVPFTQPARGEVTLPGSKSITNRALLLAALCDQPVTITNALFSEDTEIMAAALNALGIEVTSDAPTRTMRVAGQGGKIPAKTAKLFVGNAGTAARFLTALCAAAPDGVYHLDGVPQMRKRPMKGLIEALRTLGADIRCLGAEGFFPFEIHAHGLRGGAVTIDASESSQMMSALLMIAPLAKADVQITQANNLRWPFVQMTARLRDQFGQPAIVRSGSPSFTVTAGRPYRLSDNSYLIEPDATAASYFLALPLVAGGEIKLPLLSGRTDGLQYDTQFILVLKQVGLVTSGLGSGITGSSARSSVHSGVDWNFNTFSDTFLTLAAIAPLLEGPTRITGIAHTRKQETDRVAGMARELRKLGQEVIEEEDALTITPNLEELRRRAAQGLIEIETYNDHRFAMSFAILGCHDLLKNGQAWLRIRNPGCCAKTFPGFFEELAIVRANSHPSSDFIIVAIDGGAASGKSTTARALSERFNLLHVDTGSFYRAMTAELLRRKVSPTDLPALRTALAGLQLNTRVTGRRAEMQIDGRVAGEEIRSREVNEHVSLFAAVPELRQALLAYQRGQADVAKRHGFRGLAMEGRDIGSVIFPDADFRFFLQADPAERARRRQAQGEQDAIQERDRLDSTRKAAPLACPPGAIAIDSTHLTPEEVVARLAAAITPRLSAV